MNATSPNSVREPQTVIRELHVDSVLFTVKALVAVFTAGWGLVVLCYPDVFGSFPSYRAARDLVHEDTVAIVTIAWSMLQMLRLLHAARWPRLVAAVLDASFAVFWVVIAVGVFRMNATPPPVGGAAAFVLASMSALVALVTMSERMGE